MSEKYPKNGFFFIQTSTLIPWSIKTIRYISKVQKHGTELVTWLHFLFYNFSSKPHCCPYKEADLKAVKVVNFATKWLNLYPHTVVFAYEIIPVVWLLFSWLNQQRGGTLSCNVVVAVQMFYRCLISCSMLLPPHVDVGLYRVLARPRARVIATAYKVLKFFLLWKCHAHEQSK